MINSIGIYDRWLHTLGGGEKHTIDLAQAFSKLVPEVEILTHRPTSIEKLQEKFGIKKINFKIRYIPESWDYELSPYTKEYDLFVLSSFADMVGSQSKKSILSVFFPMELNLSFSKYLIRVIIIPLFRLLFQFPLYIQNDNNKLITVATNKKVRNTTIHLHFPNLALSVVEQIRVTSIGEIVTSKIRVLHKSNTVELSIKSKNPVRQWQIELPNSEFSTGVMVSVTASLWNKVGLFLMNLSSALKQRCVAGPRKFSKKELESYQTIIANSKYTQKWIKNYWNKESEVIYPPVDIANFSKTEKKKKWIVSVGRFFVSGHNKKQLEMVEAFKQISSQMNDWELHLVGSVNDAQIHKEYLEKVLQASKGYPITVHTDINFSKLKNILAQSSIYWHAAGLGSPENKEPEKLEHFGLSIVEAMAAGCVPVVINKGGPAEIGDSVGYTWNTLKELQEITLSLSKNSKLLTKLQTKSINLSKAYNNKNFEYKVTELLKKVNQ